MIIQSLTLTALLFTSSCYAFSLVPSPSGQHLHQNKFHLYSQLTTSTILNPQQLNQKKQRRLITLFSSSTEESETTESSESSSPSTSSKKKTKKLTLLTFDLDDTLYPMSKVAIEANKAFGDKMENFGFEKAIGAKQIVTTERELRKRMAEVDPERSACLTHTETRRLAIREEMEKMMYERKLERCAEDWATQVSSLSPLVVQNAKTWAHTAVSSSVVEAVVNAWEMERHHSAERHLYPDVIETFIKIKEEHPHVIIGAVTDGKANPLLMTFTLAKHFDFSVNWEDDQAGRKKFFTDLGNVEKDADLKWIYNATKEKGDELIKAAALLRGEEYPFEDVEEVWIHIGDDLALDVGGSATVGAKTILAELDDKRYGQTARHRFDQNSDEQPDWSSTPIEELERRKLMNSKAEALVDQKVAFISHIPEAINSILEMED